MILQLRFLSRFVVVLGSALVFGASVAAKDLQLALNWKAEPQFGGFYAADFGGHFKKQNLKVKVMEGGSGTPTIQMVMAGTVEYAVVSADEIVLAHSRGAANVVALFAAYQINPQAIMTHAEKSYTQLEDLFKDGSATLLWQSGLPYAQYIAKKYGPLKVKQAPYSGGIGPFLADANISQQCFFTSEPLLAEEKGKKVKTFLVAETGYNPYTTVLVTQKNRLAQNPEEVKKMVQAIRNGWNDYLKDPRATNSQMSKINPSMDSKAMDASFKAQLSLIETQETKSKGVGFMTQQRWQELLDQLLELKVITKKPKAEDLFQLL